MQQAGELTPEQLTQLHLDAFQNLVTGLGNPAFDKTKNATHCREPELPQRYLTDLATTNWLAKRICGALPGEMLRPGYELTLGGDVEKATSVRMRLDELQACVRLEEGLTWERACGGCAIMIVADDGAESASEPLNEKNIRRILSFNVIERERCVAYAYYTEGTKLGEVSHWLVSNTLGTSGAALTLVHESRLIIFKGEMVTAEERISRSGWGGSVLQVVHGIIADHDLTWNALSLMIQNANMGIWKMKDFLKSVRGGNKELVEYLNARLRMTQMTMGGTRDIKLDADGESYERIASRFEGIPDSISMMLLLVSGAARTPVMVLFGQNPTGLNATGEGDMQWWYDETDVARAKRLKPALERMIRLVMLEKEGPTNGVEPADWDLKFPDLKRMSDAEQVEIRNKQAQTDAIELQWGVVTPAEVRKSRHRPEGWTWRTELTKEGDAQVSAKPGEEDSNQEGEQTPPGDPKATDGGEDAPPANPNAVDPKAALQAGQISAMLEVITAVAEEKIPRETGIAILVASFPIDESQAEAIMGEVGKSFTKKPEPKPPMFGGALPPKPGEEPQQQTPPKDPNEDPPEDA